MHRASDSYERRVMLHTIGVLLDRTEGMNRADRRAYVRWVATRSRKRNQKAKR